MHLLGATLQDHLSHGLGWRQAGPGGGLNGSWGGVYGWSLEAPPG